MRDINVVNVGEHTSDVICGYIIVQCMVIQTVYFKAVLETSDTLFRIM